MGQQWGFRRGISGGIGYEWGLIVGQYYEQCGISWGVGGGLGLEVAVMGGVGDLGGSSGGNVGVREAQGMVPLCLWGWRVEEAGSR